MQLFPKNSRSYIDEDHADSAYFIGQDVLNKRQVISKQPTLSHKDSRLTISFGFVPSATVSNFKSSKHQFSCDTSLNSDEQAYGNLDHNLNSKQIKDTESPKITKAKLQIKVSDLFPSQKNKLAKEKFEQSICDSTLKENERE